MLTVLGGTQLVHSQLRDLGLLKILELLMTMAILKIGLWKPLGSHAYVCKV